MLTVDALRAWGANVDEGLGRCMNNEPFYLRMVDMALADPNFDRLDAALAAGDAKAAFDAAHALKGAIGNVSLSPIYDPIVEITEAVRGCSELPDVSDPARRVRDALAGARALA